MLHRFRPRSFAELIDVLQYSLEHFFSDRLEKEYEEWYRLVSRKHKEY